VVQVARLTDGKRKVLSISEITGMEGEVITMQEVFSFKQTGVDTNGKVLGQFRASGVRPRFCERLRSFGVDIDDLMFDPSRDLG
jgi:pilus assembly protein CpaF